MSIKGLRKAAGRKAPEQAIRALVRAYIRFAHEQKHFYDVFLKPCAETTEGEAAHIAFVELCAGAGRTDLRAKEGTRGGHCAVGASARICRACKRGRVRPR